MQPQIERGSQGGTYRTSKITGDSWIVGLTTISAADTIGLQADHGPHAPEERSSLGSLTRIMRPADCVSPGLLVGHISNKCRFLAVRATSAKELYARTRMEPRTPSLRRSIQCDLLRLPSSRMRDQQVALDRKSVV